MSSLAIGALATLLAVAAAPVAEAQSDRENSTFTVTEPVDVGGFTLEPGTYLIKVVMLSSNRNMIQVTNEAQTKIFASVLATPHPIRPGEAAPSSRYVYYPAVAGHNKALRTWFARDTSNGQDIVYPKRHAMELAVAVKEPVIAVPDDVKETELETAPLAVVTPEKQVKPYEPPPVVASTPARKPLPQTASPVPLLAALGLLSLGGAFGLRALASKVS